MSVYHLGLGSNSGDRRQNLEFALREIRSLSRNAALRTSSIHETPALLPDRAPSSWNRPFWNLVAEIHYEGSPRELLHALNRIEYRLGRIREERWAPRTIDIDILLGEDVRIDEKDLQIPHPGVESRGFVLCPLAELSPDLKLPSGKFVWELARAHPLNQTRLMGILNLTPDSFSDGGNFSIPSNPNLALQHEMSSDVIAVPSVLARLDRWDSCPVPLLDLGGESTRPGSKPLSPDAEWNRVRPVLEALRDRYCDQILRPRLSIDTFRPETARKALEFGVDILNDVSGLASPEMTELLISYPCQIILMHSLTVPADPSVTLPEGESPLLEILEWFDRKLEELDRAGIQRERLILDPGLGFGKKPLQSLEILQSAEQMQRFGCPVLIGHSRKSFFADLTACPPQERDPETLGASLALAAKGIDLLRVHDPVLHHRAMLAWRHSQKEGPSLHANQETPHR